MKNRNGTKYNIPILKFPKSADEFVCYIFNKEKKFIEIYFINMIHLLKKYTQLKIVQ